MKITSSKQGREGRITSEFSEGGSYHVGLEGEFVDLSPTRDHQGTSAAAGGSNYGGRPLSTPAATAACTPFPGTTVAARHLQRSSATRPTSRPMEASHTPAPITAGRPPRRAPRRLLSAPMQATAAGPGTGAVAAGPGRERCSWSGNGSGGSRSRSVPLQASVGGLGAGSGGGCGGDLVGGGCGGDQGGGGCG
jgi:hypothetical protein